MAGKKARPPPPFGAPEGIQPTPELRAAATPWIASIHPGKCLEAINALTSERWANDDASTMLLLAHCIQHHALPIDAAAKASSACLWLPECDGDLIAAIRTQAADWCNALLHGWRTIAATPGCQRIVSLLAQALDGPQFAATWKGVWESDRPEASPTLFRPMVWQALFGANGPDDAARFIRANLQRLGAIDLELTVDILRQPAAAGIRESALEGLAKAFGSAADRVIADAYFYDKAPPAACLEVARRLVKGNDAKARDHGLLLGVRMAPAEFLPFVASLSHDRKGRWYPEDHVDYHVAELVPDQLMAELAKDSTTKGKDWQRLFADSDHRLAGSKAATTWLLASKIDDTNNTYATKLAIEVLSAHRAAYEADKGPLPDEGALCKLAGALFQKYGKQSEKEVLVASSANNHRSKPAFPVLRALALLQAVLSPPPAALQVEQVIACIRTKFPATYKALGGKNLEGHLRKGGTFPGDRWYEDEVSKHEGTPEPKTDIDAYRWGRAQYFLAARKDREEHLARIHKNGGILREAHLRSKNSAWTEVHIWARLVKEFKVTTEPEGMVPGKATKPDFLIESAEGKALIEVVEEGTGLGDLDTNVKVSDGTELQPLLDDKWKQLGSGDADLGMPAMVAIRPRFHHDLYDSVFYSCYGPPSHSFTTNTADGQIVAEGSFVADGKGLFRRPKSHNISAVLGFVPQVGQEALVGKMNWPISDPTHPLPRQMWLKLRRCLFGEAYDGAFDKVPTITEKDAAALHSWGYSDVESLIRERWAHEEAMGISRKRFDELRAQALRATRIHQEGRLELLEAAKGHDLAPLKAAGIHTVRQVASADKPGEVAQNFWDALRAEAASFGYYAKES